MCEFRVRPKCFHRFVCREQLPLSTHTLHFCFVPAVKSVFKLTQTQSIVTVILST